MKYLQKKLKGHDEEIIFKIFDLNLLNQILNTGFAEKGK